MKGTEYLELFVSFNFGICAAISFLCWYVSFWCLCYIASGALCHSGVDAGGGCGLLMSLLVENYVISLLLLVAPCVNIMSMSVARNVWKYESCILILFYISSLSLLRVKW